MKAKYDMEKLFHRVTDRAGMVEALARLMVERDTQPSPEVLRAVLMFGPKDTTVRRIWQRSAHKLTEKTLEKLAKDVAELMPRLNELDAERRREETERLKRQSVAMVEEALTNPYRRTNLQRATVEGVREYLAQAEAEGMFTLYDYNSGHSVQAIPVGFGVARAKDLPDEVVQGLIDRAKPCWMGTLIQSAGSYISSSGRHNEGEENQLPKTVTIDGVEHTLESIAVALYDAFLKDHPFYWRTEWYRVLRDGLAGAETEEPKVEEGFLADTASTDHDVDSAILSRAALELVTT